MKTIHKWLLNLIILAIVVVIFLPLFYLLFWMLILMVPLIYYMFVIHHKKPDEKPDTAQFFRQLGSYLILLPLVLLAINSIPRTILVALYSFYPAALMEFNAMHDFIYTVFMPFYGSLTPYWLDLWWGLIGVVVIFFMALLDSYRRNMLVRQIQSMPMSKAHSAAMGIVKLKGKAIPLKKSHDAPLIRSWTEKDARGRYGSRIESWPFYLDDGTGKILIDPKGCEVGTKETIFEIQLHHAILKRFNKKNAFPEYCLMPNDNVYVLGNLQINRDAAKESNKADSVIIKPKRSSMTEMQFYDLFFVSNTGEKELLIDFHQSIKRGWLGVFAMMLIPAWLSIYAWTNITQITHLDLDAVPQVFRWVSTQTELERPVEVLGQSQSALFWLNQINIGADNIDEIMDALHTLKLEHLAIPALIKQASDIENANFGEANQWLQKLQTGASESWGFQYWDEEGGYAQQNESLVFSVLLTYTQAQLSASYRAFFGPVNSPHFHLSDRAVVFEFINQQTGDVYQKKLLANEQWNLVDDVIIFDNIQPGQYLFSMYAEREYHNGASDKGSRSRKASLIHL